MSGAAARGQLPIVLAVALSLSAASGSLAASDFLVLTTGPGRGLYHGVKVAFEGSGSNSLEQWSPGAAIGTILSNDLPSGMCSFNAAVDSDGGQLFYATQGGVHVVDLATGTVSSTLQGSPFYCLQFDAGGGRLFAMRPVGVEAVLFDGGTAVYTNDLEILLEIDPVSGAEEVKGELPGGLRNYNCTLDADGRRFFYQTEEALAFASLDSGELLELLPLPLNLYGLEFDTASGLLYAMVIDPDCVGSACGESGGSFYAAYRTTPNMLVAIDPDSGLVEPVTTNIPSGGMNFLSALDPVARTYRYRTRDELIVVSLASGAVLERTVIPEIWVAMNSLLPTVRRIVEIDIKPQSKTNSVNPRSKGVLPVAILASSDLDVSTIDSSSVRFGPDGARPAHRGGHRRDVDGDGDVDLLFHFRVPAIGVACGDTTIGLEGTFLAGGAFEGNDRVRTVGCSRSN